jgi:hypothetical protein
MIKPPSQAPFAPVPTGLVQLFAFRFYLSAFRFSPALPPFRLLIPHFSFFIHHCAFPHSSLTALCSRKAVPPSGSRYRVIYRACSHRLGPAIFIYHSSFIIYL